MGIRVEVNLLEILVTEPLECFFAHACPGGGRAEETDDRRALGAAETAVAPCNHISGDPTLPVSRPGECDKTLPTGDKILHFHGISDGEDIRVAGPHLLVNADAAAFPDLESGLARKFGVRSHANTKNDDVRRERLAGLGDDIQRVGFRLPELGRPVVENHLHSVPFEMSLDYARHILVDRREHLPAHLDDRHIEAAMDEVLRHLETDESATHNHGAGLRAGSLESRVAVHAGEKHRTLLQPLPDRPGIRHGANLEYAGQVYSR